ncbi:LytTR family transcriptional regulator [Chitinophaga horti]|uniref:LytTR family transcriptional regulator n=1 Tax=Chitinophaga horti TaxID=2920382 RepID=A0ABY6J8B8_9BACT|nr:LytTR family DNA-binding domain-containing protein [Chitinophaga horti]UYQ95933.1 LytTR family transcriptional regulator [Chitinophaga horti]
MPFSTHMKRGYLLLSLLLVCMPGFSQVFTGIPEATFRFRYYRFDIQSARPARYGFIRPHQSHVVNLHAIKSYLKEDGGTLLMQDGQRIPGARQHRDMVKLRLERG